MTASLPATFSSIDDIQEIESKGPWQTKSGGELSVLFNISLEVLRSSFFSYDTDELALIPEDIRGMRSYRVNDIPKDSVGAHEWHKTRHELIFVISGSVRWTCEDIHGKKRVSLLDANKGIWVKPYILHTYEALSDNTSLLVIANTLFMPDNPGTHDTYSAESFKDLQASTVAATK
ncbi:MAG: WxcM-like domain-containing protein [Candidatus Saccharimonadales bacterium]